MKLRRRDVLCAPKLRRVTRGGPGVSASQRPGRKREERFGDHRRVYADANDCRTAFFLMAAVGGKQPIPLSAI